MRHRLGRATTIAAVTALVFSAAMAVAQVMYPQRGNLQILDAPDIAGVPVTTVEPNIALQVMSKKGRWDQVKLPAGTVGWVLESALAAKQGSGQGGLTNVMSLGKPTLDTAAAGRGIASDGARQYAASKHYDPAILQQIFEIRIRARGQWRAFVRTGGLTGAPDLVELKP
jgi:hypothetical protein